MYLVAVRLEVAQGVNDGRREGEQIVEVCVIKNRENCSIVSQCEEGVRKGRLAVREEVFMAEQRQIGSAD